MAKVQESSRKFKRLAFPLSAVPAGVGSVVAAERVRRRWSQAKLAMRSDVSRATIYRLESGDRPSSADTLFRVAHALEMTIRELVPDWPEWEPIMGNGPGEAMRERRRSLDMSLAELASSLGVSEATLSRHERGVCSSPRLVRRLDGNVAAQIDALVDALSLQKGAASARDP